MMTFRALTLLLLAWACPPPLWAQEIEDLKKGVVKIVSQVEGRERIGSGFIVSQRGGETFIVTAAHVVAGARTPVVEFYADRPTQYAAQIVETEGDDEDGLAALFINTTFREAAIMPLNNEKITVNAGDQVVLPHLILDRSFRVFDSPVRIELRG
jgi:S1-C subfamily serine protease